MSVDSVKSNTGSDVKIITKEPGSQNNKASENEAASSVVEKSSISTKGSYDENTAKGKSANVGENVGELLKGGGKDINTSNDIRYSSKKENGSADIDAGLAYSSNVIKSADENKDGGITLDKTEKNDNSEQKRAEKALGIEDISVADANLDGLVDKAEYLSLTLLQDSTLEKGPDAIASVEEAKILNEFIKTDAESVKLNIKAIHDTVVAEKAKDFKMPTTKMEQVQNTVENNNKVIEKTRLEQNTTNSTRLNFEETSVSSVRTNTRNYTPYAERNNNANIQDVENIILQFLSLFLICQQLGLPIDQVAGFLGADLSGFAQRSNQYSPMFNPAINMNPVQQNIYSNINSINNHYFQDNDPTDDLINPFTKYAFM